MKLSVLIFAAILNFINAGLYEECDQLFETFQKKYKKFYGSLDEKSSRHDIFCENMKRADDLNELNGERSFGWKSKFADFSTEEFEVLLGRKDRGKKYFSENGLIASAPVRRPKHFGAGSDVVDWTAAGAVTPVKNQGQCGSCWAHSVAETIESQWVLDGNSMWEFSVQQINSCTTDCYGCGGGDTIYAYEYIMGLGTHTGLGSNAFAPYVQSMYEECSGKTCTESCSDLDVDALIRNSALTGYYAQVTGYEYATTPCIGACDAQNMTELAANVEEYGPASICVNAASWNLYEGGVMTTEACGGFAYGDLDHCVQLTGYNATAPTPYWIVRNSWATDWGEAGYIYLEMSDTANTCGLADEATFVTLANTAA